MKVIIAPLLLAFVFLTAICGKAQQKTAFSSFITTNMHTVATNFVSTNLWVMKATLTGLKAGGVANGATCYVGTTTTNAYFAITTSGQAVIEAQPGTLFNLKDWYLRTPTTGDGLYIIYQ